MIEARYPSSCIVCQGEIAPGDQVHWSKGEGCWCAGCDPEVTGAACKLSDAPPAWMLAAAEQGCFKTAMKEMREITLKLSLQG